MHSEFDTTTQEYVEIIYEIQKENKVARVKDIAEMRGVTRASVSTVLNMLKKKALISHETYGLVQLTARGEQLAEELERRHKAIKDFCVNILDIEPHKAEVEACQLEHHISSEVMDSLITFTSLIERNPDWLSKLKNIQRS